MKGITIYTSDIKRGMDRMTNEELGFVLRTFINSLESEIIPTFDDDILDMKADGFKVCMEKGLDCVKRKKEGVNNRWKQYKDKGDEVSCYSASTNSIIEKTQNEDIDENNIQLLLAKLEEVKPQKNQTMNLLKMNNKQIREYIENNSINNPTAETAWNIYKAK